MISGYWRKNKPYISVFFICFVYWIYLFFSSSISIVFDAIRYEELGRLINEQGWRQFFLTGPHREPFYPLLVAISMRCGSLFSINYHFVQKLIQVGFLFISQLLMIALMSRLKIDRTIQWVTILYFGFSPTIVGATFSLYSEIAAVPFVLAMVLLLAVGWNALRDSSLWRMMLLGFLAAVVCLPAAFTKSVLIPVFLACLIPFVFRIMHGWVCGAKKVCLNAAVFTFTSLFVLTTATGSYMLLNKIHNGHFRINDRNSSILMGSAIKRSMPLTSEIFLAHLASIPGKNVCSKFFSQAECDYADWFGSEGFRLDFLKTIQNEPPEVQDSLISRMTIGKILERPFQFVLFMIFSGAQMLFWESTQSAFVEYPKGLQTLLENPFLRNGLRFCVSLLTIFSLFYVSVSIFCNQSLLLQFSENAQRIQTCLFILIIIFAYITMYALCYCLLRYTVPISSLYMLSIAYCVQNLKSWRIK